MERAEFFADDRLGDGVVRLYERYAELLPAGPARDRAAATARSVAALLGSFDLDRWATAIAADVQFVDHRSLVGFGSMRGAQAMLGAAATSFQVADDIAIRCDQVIAAEPDALLVRWTSSGKARIGGGAYEKEIVQLCRFGADGLMTHAEQFGVGREAEALARLDALTAEPSAAPTRATKKSHRRVRPNAATANTARLDAAIAARDADALPTLVAEHYEVVDHSAGGATYDGSGSLASWRAMLRAQDLRHGHAPLATLGDSLVLARLSVSASGIARGKFDVGPYEHEVATLIEVDARGRRVRSETFATGRLSDGVARLYERYAELLPDGPARVRAAATARSVATMLAPPDSEWTGAALASAVEFVDHRTLGFGSSRGAEAFMRGVRAGLDITVDVSSRVDDILDLRSDALLVRWMNSGTARAGGGAFERHLLMLWVFGADGLVARVEEFDAEREDQALARFDELTARSAERHARRVRPNAVTAHAARFDAAFIARDADAYPTLLADEYEVVDHTTGVTYDREGELASFRALRSAQDPSSLHEPLATLGDSLALCRLSRSASGFVGRNFDVGAHEIVVINLIEVDAQGRRRRVEVFATDRLGAAAIRSHRH